MPKHTDKQTKHTHTHTHIHIEIERGVSYLNNPVVVLLTICMTNCVNNQATNTSIKGDL